MVKLIANESFPYRGRVFAAGQEFFADDADVVLLTHEHRPRARRVASEMVQAMAVEPPVLHSLRDRARAAGMKIDGRWSASRLSEEFAKFNRYQRRDMRAEP